MENETISSEYNKEYKNDNGQFGSFLLSLLILSLIYFMFIETTSLSYRGGSFAKWLLLALLLAQLAVFARELINLTRAIKAQIIKEGAKVSIRHLIYEDRIKRTVGVYVLIIVFSLLIYWLGIYFSILFFLFTYLYFISNYKLLKALL